MAEKEYLEKSRVLEILHDIDDIYGLTELDTYYAAGFDDAINAAYNKILCEPTIPHMHGHWTYNPNGLDWNLGAWECSLCHSVNNNLPCDERIIPTIFLGSTYCPNCGAKMDEQECDEK